MFFFLQTIVLAQAENNSIAELKYDLKNIQIDDNKILKSNNYFTSEDKKSIALTILFSALLPGLGEYYAGNYNLGMYFTIADGILWSSLIGINTYGSWLENRYKSFASTYAKINPNGKDKEFFAIIGTYPSIDDYNDDKALERNFNAMLNKQTYYWNWNSVENRKTYRKLWTSSEHAYNNIRFVVGGLILNRLISIINAVRLTSSYNRKIKDSSLTFYLYMRNTPVETNKLIIGLQKNF